jgi:hypothetical protein
MLFIALLMVIGCVIDAYLLFKPEKSKAADQPLYVQMLLSFSMYSNIERVMRTTTPMVNTDQLGCLNDMR